MSQKNETPAEDRQGAENQIKVTDFSSNTQILDSYLSGIENDIKEKETILKERRKEEVKGKSYQSVLTILLYQIKPIDYREKAGIEGSDKVTRRQQIVITIDVTLETAIANNWGLCTKNDFIYVFNSRFWQAVETNDFKTFLGLVALKMGIPILEAKHHQFKEELYKQFLSSSNLPTPELKEQTLINLQNGTFEISNTGVQVLREYRQEDFIKYQLPFVYDPGAKCPMFIKFLNRVVPDIDCQMVLAEYLGYIFTRGLKLEKVLILYGTGANGKSVFFEIVNALLGSENVSNFSLQSLTKVDSYQRALLINKLVNYASEINGKLESSVFKLLASGEPVEARRIYGDPFIMTVYAKLLFNANELPKDIEFTNAFFRRFLIVPFSQTIPEEEQDPELAKKIIENELSGIFNWVLDGLQRILKQRKFTSSATIAEQNRNYRKEADSVALFIEDEGYQPSDGHPNVYLKTLYSDYKAFCSDNGYRTCSIKTVSDRLRNSGYIIEKNRDGRIVFAKK